MNVSHMMNSPVSAIFAKLQVTDRGEAIIAARDAGLGRGAS
jgi:DNA-binding NarL/FixJ family response regulator